MSLNGNRPIYLKVYGARGENILDAVRRLGTGGATESSTDAEAMQALADYIATEFPGTDLAEILAAASIAETYGSIFNTPFDHVQSAAPGSPTSGEKYINTTDGKGYLYTGAEWVNQTPREGQMIDNIEDGLEYVFSAGGGWNQTGMVSVQAFGAVSEDVDPSFMNDTAFAAAYAVAEEYFLAQSGYRDGCGLKFGTRPYRFTNPPPNIYGFPIEAGSILVRHDAADASKGFYRWIPNQDEDRDEFGSEYLDTLHKRFFDNNTSMNVVICGDSIMAGSSITNAQFLPEHWIETMLEDLGFHGVIENHAVSGTNIADITSRPQLSDADIDASHWIIIGGGPNDTEGTPGFATALEALFKRIRDRAGADVNGKAVSYNHHLINDSPDGRDTSLWSLQRHAAQYLCRKYKIHFCDDGSKYPDMRPGYAGVSQAGHVWDHPYNTDGTAAPDPNTGTDLTRTVHPLEYQNARKWGEFVQSAFPIGVLPFGYSRFLNLGTIGIRDGHDTPHSYARGMSISRAPGTLISGEVDNPWPLDGMVLTDYTPDGTVFQILITTGQSPPQAILRTSDGATNTWLVWVPMSTVVYAGSDNLLAAQTPEDFRMGLTVGRATTANGWPLDGETVDFGEPDGVHFQINAENGNNFPRFKMRARVDATHWSKWATIGSDEIDIPALENSWTADATYVPRFYMKNGVVYGAGRINAGTATQGTGLFNMPAGWCPPQDWFAPAETDSALGTNCVLKIQATGAVSIEGTNVATYIALSGISWPIADDFA